jgi:hypothetical protein
MSTSNAQMLYAIDHVTCRTRRVAIKCLQLRWATCNLPVHHLHCTFVFIQVHLHVELMRTAQCGHADLSCKCVQPQRIDRDGITTRALTGTAGSVAMAQRFRRSPMPITASASAAWWRLPVSAQLVSAAREVMQSAAACTSSSKRRAKVPAAARSLLLDEACSWYRLRRLSMLQWGVVNTSNHAKTQPTGAHTACNRTFQQSLTGVRVSFKWRSEHTFLPLGASALRAFLDSRAPSSNLFAISRRE